MRAYHGALVVAKERGGIVSVWNCAHNVGGGIPPLLFLLGMARSTTGTLRSICLPLAPFW